MWTTFLTFALAVPVATPSEVFTVTTKLQQALLGPDVNVLVLVNAQSVFDEGALDEKNAELKRIQDALSQHTMARLIAHFRIFFSRGSGDSEQYQQLANAVTKVATEAGFERTTTSGTLRNDDKTWDDVRPQMLAAEGDENPIGDKSIQAYPVRTSLSKYLTDDADCVVDILTPLNGDTPDPLDESTRKAMLDKVTKLGLTSKRKVLFVVRKGDNRSFKKFLGYARTHAEAIGFGASSVRR